MRTYLCSYQKILFFTILPKPTLLLSWILFICTKYVLYMGGCDILSYPDDKILSLYFPVKQEERMETWHWTPPFVGQYWLAIILTILLPSKMIRRSLITNRSKQWWLKTGALKQYDWKGMSKKPRGLNDRKPNSNWGKEDDSTSLKKTTLQSCIPFTLKREHHHTRLPQKYEDHEMYKRDTCGKYRSWKVNRFNFF